MFTLITVMYYCHFFFPVKGVYGAYHIYIQTITCCYPKKKVFFDMQFPFLPVGVKWKVVKNVHCPLLLINTGLMSIGPLTKKLLQKHRPVSYSKRRRKLALSPRSLTDSSAESELSRLDAHCDGLCGLVLITSSENYEKGGCETWSALRFWRSHCLDFFWGKSIWSFCRLSLNVSRISKTKPTPLSVFRLSDARARARRAHTVFWT